LLYASKKGYSVVVGVIEVSAILPALIVLTRSRAVVHPISKLILTQLCGDDNEFVLSMFYKQLFT
jgi:hypothetical protein